MKKPLTKRQEEILKVIIDEYTLTAQPIASQILIEKYFSDLSSATIRNEMALLQKQGFIIKYYLSSGRIPTLDGYKYYDEFLIKDIPLQFQLKLKDILSKRNLSIDQIIEKSVLTINEMTNLPTILTDVYANDLLKKIELIAITNHQCLFILVTSSGQVFRKEISFDDMSIINDLIICVNIFNDRLIDTPMKDIASKIDILKDLIRTKIKAYEFIIQEVVEKVFKNIDWTKTSISNSKDMTVHPEFTDVNKFQKILNLLNDVNVWKQIAFVHTNTGKTSITFNNELGDQDFSIASTTIEANNVRHDISVIGPNRLTYAKVNTLLKFLKEELEKYQNHDK